MLFQSQTKLKRLAFFSRFHLKCTSSISLFCDQIYGYTYVHACIYYMQLVGDYHAILQSRNGNKILRGFPLRHILSLWKKNQDDFQPNTLWWSHAIIITRYAFIPIYHVVRVALAPPPIRSGFRPTLSLSLSLSLAGHCVNGIFEMSSSKSILGERRTKKSFFIHPSAPNPNPTELSWQF